jgi:DNA-binding GntR family transcriptional regulator
MGPGDSAGRSDGPEGPDGLASAIYFRIAGGDLPAGAELDPERLAPLFAASADAIAAALALLEAQGVTERFGPIWRVGSSRDGSLRDLMNRAAPILRAVVGLAAARITPAEAATLLAAYDRFAGLSADSSAAARAQGYRDLMNQLAQASGSSFHVRSVASLLDEATPLIDRMVSHRMAAQRIAEPDDDLGRLARAMMQSNASAASAALEDHLILLGRYLDQLVPVRR